MKTQQKIMAQNKNIKRSFGPAQKSGIPSIGPGPILLLEHCKSSEWTFRKLEIILFVLLYPYYTKLLLPWVGRIVGRDHGRDHVTVVGRFHVRVVGRFQVTGKCYNPTRNIG